VSITFSNIKNMERLNTRKDIGRVGVLVAVGPYMKKWIRVTLNVSLVE